MNLKDQIALQVQLKTALDLKLKKVYKGLAKPKRDDLELLTQISALLEQYPTKVSVLLVFLDFLQLVDKERFLGQFELSDVDLLFQHSCQFNPEHYQLHLEYCHFLKNVLDRENDANTLMNTFMNTMKEKITTDFPDLHIEIGSLT